MTLVLFCFHDNYFSPYLIKQETGEEFNLTALEEPISIFNASRGLNEPVDCIARQRTAVIIPG